MQLEQARRFVFLRAAQSLLAGQPVFRALDAELSKHLHERFIALGQGEFHLRRNLRVFLAHNQPAGFRCFEVVAEGAAIVPRSHFISSMT